MQVELLGTLLPRLATFLDKDATFIVENAPDIGLCFVRYSNAFPVSMGRLVL